MADQVIEQVLNSIFEIGDEGNDVEKLERLAAKLRQASSIVEDKLIDHVERSPLRKPLVLPPPKLTRVKSDSNGGVLPSIWEEDLVPHVEILQNVGLAAFPQEGMEVSLREAHHLILVIHGVGKHHDFRDTSVSWDGTFGDVSGGYFDFKSTFYQMLGSKGLLRDLPVSVHFESVEWHSVLRDCCDIETVLKEASPDGVASLREFTTETMIDGLLYLSPRYGQVIIDSVAKQLNEKYQKFVSTHPGFRGPVSVFAHSLGSLIMFDLLAQTRKDVRFPSLDFDVNVLFIGGSPLAYLHLSRGDLFNGRGEYQAQYFLPDHIRVVNYYHRFDPVAWRVGPLLMGQGENEVLKENVLLPYPSMVEGKKLHEILMHFAKILKYNDQDLSQIGGARDVEDFEQIRRHRRPIDFCLPTSRYERAVELAAATNAHSSYWTSASMVLSMIMTLCEPLFPILLLYENHGVKLDVTPRRKILAFDRPMIAGEHAMMEGPVKGFWSEKYFILQSDALYVFEKPVLDTCGTLGGSLDLSRVQVACSSSSSSANQFELYVLPDQEESIDGAQSTNGEQNPKQIYQFFCKTKAEVQYWVNALNHAIEKCRAGMESTDEEDEDYLTSPIFNLSRQGLLQFSISNRWGGKSTKWFALGKTLLTWFDREPSVLAERQLDFVAVHLVQGSQAQRVIRFVYTGGGTLVLRLKSEQAFSFWMVKLREFCQHADFQDLTHGKELEETARRESLSNYGSAEEKLLSSQTDENYHHQQDNGEKEVAEQQQEQQQQHDDEEQRSVFVTGYTIISDESNNRFASFNVVIICPGNPGLNANILRRYSQFRSFHRKLVKELLLDPGLGAILPALPPTNLIPSLEESYLNRKVQRLNGYMRSLSVIPQVQKSKAWKEFLLDEEENQPL